MPKKNNNKQEPLKRQLWKAADKLRENIDAAEYKHIVLGLIFLRYISITFEELYNKLKQKKALDEYLDSKSFLINFYEFEENNLNGLSELIFYVQSSIDALYGKSLKDLTEFQLELNGLK
jgi:type I restriction-modification system DNA methylase subunit